MAARDIPLRVLWAHDIAVDVIYELLARHSAEYFASMRYDLIPDLSERCVRHLYVRLSTDPGRRITGIRPEADGTSEYSGHYRCLWSPDSG